MTTDWLSVLHLYQQTVTASLLQYLQKQTGWKGRRGIYSARVVRRGSISSRTGGYCQARQKLPKLLCKQVSEEIVERLRQVLSRDTPGPKNVFLLDGSSLELEHCPEMLGAYPPAQNQHGHSHWPVLRIAVAHDVHTGLAQPPAWGPMYGSAAVSEQALPEQIMAQLPAGAPFWAIATSGYSG
jgi:putative transposase